MKKTLDRLIPTLWKVRANFATTHKHTSLKNTLNKPQVSPSKISVINQEVIQPKSNELTKLQITPNQIINTIPIANITQTTDIQGNDNWSKLSNEMLTCEKCALCNGRTHVVIEKGNHEAKWMFIGETPNEQDNIAGKPFTQEAGELLDRMLSAMKLNPTNDVYITNLLKCRSPHNRHPLSSEIAQCQEYLFRQINLVKPKIIVTLGRLPAQSLLKTDIAIGKLRGKIHYYANIPVVVTLNPNYLLRKPEDKKLAWEDLQLAMSTVNSP